jgi:hypothetical protein
MGGAKLQIGISAYRMLTDARLGDLQRDKTSHNPLILLVSALGLEPRTP